jgi:hypothetical protein
MSCCTAALSLAKLLPASAAPPPRGALSFSAAAEAQGATCSEGGSVLGEFFCCMREARGWKLVMTLVLCSANTPCGVACGVWCVVCLVCGVWCAWCAACAGAVRDGADAGGGFQRAGVPCVWVPFAWALAMRVQHWSQQIRHARAAVRAIRPRGGKSTHPAPNLASSGAVSAKVGC